MSPIDIRDRLGDRFRLLKSSQHVPRRQQTLWDVVAWSYDLLDDGERELLGRASAFHGGFDLAAMAAMLDDRDELAVLDIVDSLVRKSLVSVDQSVASTRYVLLETIRQFAEGRLEADSSIERIRDRHARLFADAAASWWERWNGPAWRDCVDWLEAELANLRAAFRWSRSRGDIATATDVAAHAALIGASAQLFEPVGWAQELLDAATAADVARLPRLHTAAAWGCFTGDATAAVASAQAAVRLEADARYDPCEPGLSGLIEALSQVYAGHLDRYIEVAERVVALPGRAQGWGLSLLLDGLQAAGRTDEALAMVDAAMAAARALGNPYFIAYAYWTMGGAWSKSDPERSLAVWREGLDYVHQHRVDFFVGFIARDAAQLRLVDADPADALAMFDAAIDAFEQAGNVAQLTITLASATALFERIGRLESSALLHGAVTGPQGGDRHVPELSDLARRLEQRMGGDQFRAAAAQGAALRLGDAAQLARRDIQQARVELENRTARAARPGGLSVREVEVLRLAAEGLTTKEIGERLFISARTADRHIQNIYTKIDTSNRAGATRWALEHGLLD
jgi:DNA-binding CsgD family transcriptional regulator